MILKKQRLVSNISNIVTSNQCANTILASGAKPVMSEDANDIEDLISISSSLVINIGTANQNKVSTILRAQSKALQKGIPIILDPVGSGASKFRTKLARDLVAKGVTIVRGNISEILSLVTNEQTKGVDSAISNFEDDDSLKKIASDLNINLLVSGTKDKIIYKDKNNILQLETINGGHPNMTLVTGLGCMQSSLIGALVTELSTDKALLFAAEIMKELGNSLFSKNKLPSYNQIYNFIFNYEQ